MECMGASFSEDECWPIWTTVQSANPPGRQILSCHRRWPVESPKRGLGSFSPVGRTAMIQGADLCVDRLKQDGISVKIQELPLPTGEPTDIDCLGRVDAHSL